MTNKKSLGVSSTLHDAASIDSSDLPSTGLTRDDAPFRKPLRPGLYLIPTPIGNLSDITLRAVHTLERVDVVLCEDTRISGKLLGHLGFTKKMLPYHEHNASKMRPKILKSIAQGQVIGMISDAGTPLISDPGFKLVRDIQDANLFMTSLPGPCAVITALTLSGFPTDAFTFGGFFDKKKWQTSQSLARHVENNSYVAPSQKIGQHAWSSHKKLCGTLIFFSTSHKLLKDLSAMKQCFGTCQAAVVREISKIYEEVRKGPIDEVMEHYTHTPPRGEIVVLLSPSEEKEATNWSALLKEASTMSGSLKDKAAILADQYGLSKRDVYQAILKSVRK